MAEISAWYVVLMGIGTVFVGLICIILLCSALGKILSLGKKQEVKTEDSNFDPKQKDELLAVLAASIAAFSNKDPKGVKILSVKRIK